MASISSGTALPPPTTDRVVFPAVLVLIWFGILMGFVPQIIAKFHKDGLHYPLVVHVHAAAFVGWLVLLTAQMALVNRGNLALHRRLGLFGAGLAALMLVLGLAAAVVVDRLHFGKPDTDPPAFLIIQIVDLINFGALAAVGLRLRNDPAAHKRLILLATIFISDAGWGRWLGGAMEASFGKGFVGEWMADYAGDFALVVLFAATDLAIRRRLHPTFVKGAVFGLGLQVLAVWLDVTPWWNTMATHLLGF